MISKVMVGRSVCYQVGQVIVGELWFALELLTGVYGGGKAEHELIALDSRLPVRA